MAQASLPSSTQKSAATWPWWLLCLLAVGVYLLGLDGQYAPTNGDELVYTHIARLTAASGQWLPLVSELDHMRNTKPPLLFWQAMVAGGWGSNWSMAALRAPSVLYTLLTAAAVGLILRRGTRDIRTALLGACLFLAFFCTFRFGRTYLTSAPETFWLGLPMLMLLWRFAKPTEVSDASQRQATSTGTTHPLRSHRPGWGTHIGWGLAIGLGLAYKSFALVAPVAATLWCAQLAPLPELRWRDVLRISFQVGLTTVVALGLFGLWFVLDPDPAAVWQEFVVGENAGKLNNSVGYWRTALAGGGFSIWALALGYVQNAGLLAFVVLGLMLAGARAAWQRWRYTTQHAPQHAPLPAYQKLLLIWLGVWLLVFMLPSQRSARYLIPVMPALAMLMALYWQRIARGWFVPSLLLCGVFMAVLARIAWAENDLAMSSVVQFALTQGAAGVGLALVIAGLVRAVWTRACTLAATLAVFAIFGLATAPLNGSAGHYPTETLARVQHQTIAVPSSFNGQFERFEFVLPGNRLAPYDGDARAFLPVAENAAELQRLLATHDAVVWLQTRAEGNQPLCLPECTVLAQRWEVKGRHQSGEITLTNLWYPQRWLFRREWLISR
ncbi:MAG: hypothetical protein AUJ20_04875 [Comamonadaceae bacterium CG1_02_60_18]|nr:MAG: hypothetical protein AUJ20_04875 [Comamonadaceae bacterium CG1_02_60_18]PIQ50478.1 MAG: glycosyl transferase family 39 [Comamonadaceae bacterium CG12_big_fil_rev_8_21_14_0_65_59_15]